MRKSIRKSDNILTNKSLPLRSICLRKITVSPETLISLSPPVQQKTLKKYFYSSKKHLENSPAEKNKEKEEEYGTKYCLPF